MDKRIRLLNAWIERWNLSDEEASIRLSRYRKVTVEQVVKMKDGSLIPSVSTFNAWAVEINSSPKEYSTKESPFCDMGAFNNLFGDIWKGFGK